MITVLNGFIFEDKYVRPPNTRTKCALVASRADP